MDLTGQVAVVTGGTRGIGKAIAEELAKKGVQVIVCGRNPETAQQTAAALSSFGVKTLGVRLDVSNSEETISIPF
jgi:3-oxoacyl-[acyl-carrier protein] reductase